MHLLLVEDDRTLAQQLKQELNRAGYAVTLSFDGIDGQFLGEEEPYDAAILDLGLPGRAGLEVLRNWRSKGIRLPVLVLTARNQWHERVEGLRAGADDYLGKPFHSQELIARIEALLRRHHGRASNRIEAGSLLLDCDARTLRIGDREPEPLTGIEFRLLRILMLEPQRIHSKAELTEHIYEEDQQRDSNVLEVYVNRLRKRFGRNLIETLRRQGYRLGAPH